MMVVGAAPDPIEVTPRQLIFGRLRFAELTGVRPMIETYPPPASIKRRSS
jgi:hypothetical protein